RGRAFSSSAVQGDEGEEPRGDESELLPLKHSASRRKRALPGRQPSGNAAHSNHDSRADAGAERNRGGGGEAAAASDSLEALLHETMRGSSSSDPANSNVKGLSRGRGRGGAAEEDCAVALAPLERVFDQKAVKIRPKLHLEHSTKPLGSLMESWDCLRSHAAATAVGGGKASDSGDRHGARFTKEANEASKKQFAPASGRRPDRGEGQGSKGGGAMGRTHSVAKVAEALDQVKLVQEQMCKLQGGSITATALAPMPSTQTSLSLNQSFNQSLGSCSQDSVFEPPAAAPYFDCPVLPIGQTLVMTILSTWGDPHYVGMAGLEIFDHMGAPITIAEPEKQVTGVDMNTDGNSFYDPRTTDKLVDGHPHTCDDLHSWLAPFQKDNHNSVTIVMDSGCQLGALRLWNYNQSRTHTGRGARHVQITLDGHLIFEGEVRKAPGILSAPEQCSELILFTHDEVALEGLERHDKACGYEVDDSTEALVTQLQEETREKERRPRTAGCGGEDKNEEPTTERTATKVVPVASTRDADYSDVSAPPPPRDTPPKDSPRTLLRLQHAQAAALGHTQDVSGCIPGSTAAAPVSSVKKDLISARTCTLVIVSTWGDTSFYGLSGLQVLTGANCQATPLPAEHISTRPRGIAATVPRMSVQKLAQGNHLTTAEDSMWLAPFRQGALQAVVIDLGKEEEIGGLIVWNFNKSGEDLTKGVRGVHLLLDDKPVGYFELRMAPGCAGMEYGQTILLDRESREAHDKQRSQLPGGGKRLTYISPLVKQDFEAPLKPTGMLLEMRLHSTWGDQYYIGLDSIQVFGADGQEVQISPDEVRALPESLAILGQEDNRVPGNLTSGNQAESRGGSQAWLAPLYSSLDPQQQEACCGTNCNSVFLLFSVPVCITMIKIRNYSKDPWRGVKDLSLFLDGSLIFMGSLKQEPTTLLFVCDPGLAQTERPNVPYCGDAPQNVVCIGEREMKLKATCQAANVLRSLMFFMFTPTNSQMIISQGDESEATGICNNIYCV
ncbi:unnamed protein product, partial [Chrysoparadoxa australica]